MRFKKLDILGFKSFAEPTQLLFEPGVTAIVGPNGCGKSNIADAIKWVLGEQSARELRGGRMEDLIFNGSDRREPVNYAEVSLTLDNSDKRLAIDYTEVTISRRLYRSGESEYVLNGTAVRLKDIQELLMGTGVGTSAYSLFEQGRIEQIISARPEDRRVIFEEAAGITKFKSQKREALRKLEETEENLARVGDVVAEVKRQIQALERQVRRAKLFQEQFDQLRQMEIDVARIGRAQIESQAKSKEEASRGIREKAAELESQLGGQEGRLELARNEVSETDQALAQAREKHMSVTHSQETVRHRIQVTRERLAEGDARRAEIDGAIAAAQEQIQKLAQSRQELSEVIARAGGERQAKEQQIAAFEQTLQECARLIAEAESAIAATQGQLLERTVSQSQLKNELAKAHQEATRLEARASRLQTEGLKVAREREEAGAQVQALEAQLQRLQSELESITERRNERRDALAAADAALQSARQRAESLAQQMMKSGSQLEIIKGLVATHEGYSSGVKALLNALDEGRLPREGVDGVLAELIQISPEDTAAVDAALGQWAEAVVVESAAAAESCRRFLEQSQAGRVLFLIRERVRELPRSAGEPAPAPAVKLIDRIGITPHLEPLLRLLIDDAWLVPDREAARAVAAQFPSIHPRFVTPAGEFFTGPTELLGSAPSEEGLVVGRASRLQSLEVVISRIEQKLADADRELAGAEQVYREAQQQIAELEAESQEKAGELQRVKAACESARAVLEKLEQEEQILKGEQQEIDAELSDARSRAAELEAELAEKERELSAMQQQIESAQAGIAQFTQRREEASVALARLKAELASFDQVLQSRITSLQLLEQTIETSKAQAASYREELARIEEARRGWESSCAELEASLSEMAQQELAASAEVAAAEQRKAAALEAAQGQERQWLVISRQLEQLQSQIHQQEMEQAQLNFQKEQIASRIEQVYQMSLDDLLAAPAPEYDEQKLEETKARIAELSQKLQKMGPVNLGSIEEERELQTRYDHMVTQQADLAKAKDDLHEAITKINRTTRAMFRETFQAIQAEFQVTFKQLFGGGEARLVLLDEEDLLETGIEIIARPPGKPVQAITLLSGGEKTLTSIALLFAIFRIKPSPFCMLDEIDAALDETNIGRFTGALKEFLKESQFIIITHNKKTITMADVMYGITMIESGVSRIVSVKLRQAEEKEKVAS